MRRAGLVTAYNSRAVAQTLNELLGNASLYQRLKAGCRKVADEISWDRLVGGMEH